MGDTRAIAVDDPIDHPVSEADRVVDHLLAARKAAQACEDLTIVRLIDVALLQAVHAYGPAGDGAGSGGGLDDRG